MWVMIIINNKADWLMARQEDIKHDSHTRRILGRGKVESARYQPATKETRHVKNEITSHKPHDKA